MNKNELIVYINQRLDSLASKDELLITSVSQAKTNAMGMNVTQKTTADVLLLEDESFSQAESSSSFIKSANRMYDDFHGTVTLYKGKTLSSLSIKDSKKLTYDETISINGKLNQKKYYVHPLRVRPKDMIHEKYLEKEEPGCKRINGIITHEINENSVIRIEQKENTVFMVLKPKYSHPYFAVQVKNNGDFEDFPLIEEATLEMTFSHDQLISMVSREKYRIKFGFFPLSVEMESKTQFIEGKNHIFIIDGNQKELFVPKPEETFSI